MIRLTVGLGERSYPILIGPGLARDPAAFDALLGGKRAVLVTSETVATLHAPALERALDACACRWQTLVIADGEEQKSWATLDQLYTELLRQGADRKTLLLALGGGVVGDLVGFAAATYQRGIDFIQIPTTLLAQVDSAVGGKTAINHPLGKNMIGAFHQPRAVIADTDTLATLPGRELSAGLAEVIKYGIIRDPAFFAWLEENIDPLRAREASALAHAIARSCEIKAAIVAEDEREAGIRALLNLGHTFGHAIETLTGYGTWLHGEAVSAGTVLATRLAVQLGRLAPADAERIIGLLGRAGLPVAPPRLPVDAWLAAMGRDKKNEGGRITLILPDAIGAASVVKDAPLEPLQALLASTHG
jgi:3-dehydroquinate synthase